MQESHPPHTRISSSKLLIIALIGYGHNRWSGSPNGPFCALVAPHEMIARALNRNLNLQRYKVIYICGNHSSILSRLDRRFQDIEIRRAFTVFQAMRDAAKEDAVLLYSSGTDTFLEDLTRSCWNPS